MYMQIQLCSVLAMYAMYTNYEVLLQCMQSTCKYNLYMQIQLCNVHANTTMQCMQCTSNVCIVYANIAMQCTCKYNYALYMQT